jgi:hypothetical protein
LRTFKEKSSSASGHRGLPEVQKAEKMPGFPGLEANETVQGFQVNNL